MAPSPPPSPPTIMSLLEADPNYSTLVAALKRLGLAGRIDSGSTVFAPDNGTLLSVSLAPSTVVTMPIDTLRAIILPHIGRSRVPAASFPTAPPHQRVPTLFARGSRPSDPGRIEYLDAYVLRAPEGHFVNQLPIATPDAMVTAHAVVHRVSGVLRPGARSLFAMICGDPQFTLFCALIRRGDQSQPGIFINGLSDPFNDETVLAPDNGAMRAFLEVRGGLSSRATESVFLSYIATSIPVVTARQLILYHSMPSRIFSVNFPTVFAGVSTFLGGAQLVAERGNPSLRLRDATGGVATMIIRDRLASNGVWHAIDRVLLFQPGL